MSGRPKLPICLMTSLLYLKHSFNLSDEELVVRWSENILWQFFNGMEYPLPAVTLDRNTRLLQYRASALCIG